MPMSKGGKDKEGAKMLHAKERLTGSQAARPPAGLDQAVLKTIGRHLEAHYRELVSLPVPDDLMKLLAELELKEREAKGQER